MAIAITPVESLKNVEEINATTPEIRSSNSSRALSESWPDLVIDRDTFRRQKSVCKEDNVSIERKNLLSICKLVIKELIESSLKYGRMLDFDHAPLQHFFIVLEHILRHGLKPKKGLLGNKNELWNLLETIEKYAVEAQDITISARDLPTVKSQLGRSRAWMRLALMQKKLPDYFKYLIDKKETLLNEFYESNAFVMCEEAVVFNGLLVGLNVIDCNLCLKEEDFDNQHNVIDFSLYLRDNFAYTNCELNNEIEEEKVNVNVNLETVLDQKNYLEELNRHLNVMVTNLQAKVETMITTKTLMKEDLAISKNQILSLQEEICGLKNQNNSMQGEHNRKLEDARADMTAERETYQTSRAGLDLMYSDAVKKVQEESKIRTEMLKDLENEISLKNEMETAMKFLEKDIHEKQDTIVSIRQQLEDIKLINLEMYKKLQSCESAVKHKSDLVNRMEEKMVKMSETNRHLEEKVRDLQLELNSYEEANRKLAHQMMDTDLQRSAFETDLKIEKEWRSSIQASQEIDRERISKFQSEICHLKLIEKEHHNLRCQFEKLQRTCAEHEETLQDLAHHLGESKVKMDDLKEASKVLKDAVWTADKDALTCKQCEKEFSIARRKHHCRMCGAVFCHVCSDNSMPLPSFSKPVRVCDNCHSMLLQRCTAAPQS